MALVIAFIAVFAFGIVTGWTVNSWRNGAEIARLQSRDAVVTAANEQCGKDVVSVQAGVKQVTDALAEKSRAAEDAMQKAKVEARRRQVQAGEVNSLPIREGETQCQAVEREQREYVQACAQS